MLPAQEKICAQEGVKKRFQKKKLQEKISNFSICLQIAFHFQPPPSFKGVSNKDNHGKYNKAKFNNARHLWFETIVAQV